MASKRVGSSMRRLVLFVRAHGPIPKARVVEHFAPWCGRIHWWRRIRTAVNRGYLRVVRPDHKGARNIGGVIDVCR